MDNQPSLPLEPKPRFWTPRKLILTGSLTLLVGAVFTISKIRITADVFNANAAVANASVSVSSFGARPDGKTDATTAFQRAIDSGTQVIVPPGTYVIRQLRVGGNRSLQISGTGKDITVLKQIDGTVGPLITSSNSNLEIINLTIDGNISKQQYRFEAISFDGGSSGSLRVNNVDFKNVALGINGKNVNNIFSIADSSFLNVARPTGDSYPKLSLGIYVQSGKTGSISIERNNFINPSVNDQVYSGGVELQGDAGNRLSATVANNYFEHVGYNSSSAPVGAIDVYQFTDKLIIDGNRFESLGNAAVKVANSSGVKISNNSIANGPNAAFGAIFYGASSRCPAVAGRNVEINDNIIRSWPNGAGILLAGTLPTSDACSKKPQLEGRNIVVSGNLIDQAKSGIIMDGIASAYLDGNVIDQSQGKTSSDGGILIVNSANEVTVHGGRISNGKGYGLIAQVNVSQLNLLVQDVLFTDNTFNHMYVGKLGSATLSGNTFRGEPAAVVYASEVGELWLQNNVSKTDASIGLNAITSTKVHRTGNTFDK